MQYAGSADQSFPCCRKTFKILMTASYVKRFSPIFAPFPSVGLCQKREIRFSRQMSFGFTAETQRRREYYSASPRLCGKKYVAVFLFFPFDTTPICPKIREIKILRPTTFQPQFMRIIGNIEHPFLKITMFKMDNRISVKFENALYEQTFKLGQDDRLDSPEAIQKLVDPAFLEQVLAGFQQMHQARIAAFSRAFPPENQEVFEEII